MAYAPDPELTIRTGGESRVSNFMLWQQAYTELFFTDLLWPDFSAKELDRALSWYALQDRRFGGDSTQAIVAPAELAA
jgi:undecaprenyl diphosphate synthase